jgi:hypothetical protein
MESALLPLVLQNQGFMSLYSTFVHEVFGMKFLDRTFVIAFVCMFVINPSLVPPMNGNAAINTRALQTRFPFQGLLVSTMLFNFRMKIIRAVRASDFGTCLPSVEPFCIINHDQNVNKSWAGHVDGGAI